jgi:hypothetical protein
MKSNEDRQTFVKYFAEILKSYIFCKNSLYLADRGLTIRTIDLCPPPFALTHTGSPISVVTNC